MNRTSHNPGVLFDELVIDSFAGGGGASLGIEWGIGRAVNIAINHDAEAVAMHRANHPLTDHYCQDVWQADPVQVTKGRPVGLAWFSPDCTYHSKARGSKPIRDVKRRDLAWVIIKWARAVRPRVIMLENVEEFAQWGPLVDGRPCKVRKGKTFRAWKKQLENVGYEVEHRELRACHYGTPTIRKRLFVIARCDGRPIVWPEITHGAKGGRGIKSFRTAADCIDWSIPCPSIFLTREEAQAYFEATGQRIVRPLKPKTMERIRNGLIRYVINAKPPGPFIVRCNHGGDHFRGQPVDKPFCTATSARDAHGLVMPIVNKHRGSSDGAPVDEPLPTITSGGSAGGRPAGAAHALGVTTAFIAQQNGEAPHQDMRGQAVDRPLSTVACSNRHKLVAAFLAKHYTGVVGHEVDRPAGTITTLDHHSLVGAFMAQTDHTGTTGRGKYVERVDEPLKTIATSNGHALAAANLTHMYTSNTAGGQGRPDHPIKTIVAGGNHAHLVSAFLQSYYGNSDDGSDVSKPLPTITTRDRAGLVTVNVNGEPLVIADIGMRMLTPRELFRCQGFPDTYIIDPEVDYPRNRKNGTGGRRRLTKSAQVRMVGNSVCPQVAAALVRANLVDVQLPKTQEVA